MKKILLLLSIVSVMFLIGCKKEENTQNNLQDMQNQQQVVNNNENEKIDSQFVKAYIDIINAAKATDEKDELRYDLIYFNNDEIPDLVVDNPESDISLYIYENGELINPVEKWPYKVENKLNCDYDYVEKQGTILTHSMAFNDAIFNAATLVLNSNYKFEDLSVINLGVEIQKDNPNYQEVMNYYEANGGHY